MSNYQILKKEIIDRMVYLNDLRELMSLTYTKKNDNIASHPEFYKEYLGWMNKLRKTLGVIDAYILVRGNKVEEEILRYKDGLETISEEEEKNLFELLRKYDEFVNEFINSRR
ncbi:MAG: hypothetical protein QXI33_01260 [Candidatus Pacearchaeota archaeon]